MTVKKGGLMEDTISRKMAIEALQEHRNLFCDNTPDTFSKLSYAEKSRVDELDMAIATLINLPSAQPETHEERTETHACDCISRKEAIDAHYEYCNKHPDAGFPVWSLKILEDLPSAQPEPCGDVVSRNAIVQKLNEMDRYVSTELRLCDTDKKFPQNEVFIVDDVYEEIVEQLPSAQPDSKETSPTHKALDTISRKAAIEGLWKALYEYEDKTEKQFIESEELDVADWIQHRIFVQNMSDIDRQTIRDLPSAQSERQMGEWIDYTEDGYVECPFCHSATNCDGNKDELHFCFSCGADMRAERITDDR